MTCIEAELRERLVSFAMKHCRSDRSLAEDAASDSIMNCIEKDNLTFQYGSTCVKNFLSDYYRKRNRLSSYDAILYDAEVAGEPVTIDVVQKPNQHERLFVTECLERIDIMSDSIRSVMILAAKGNTADEIARTLDIPKRHAEMRVKAGRKQLRHMDGYGHEAKRGHSRFIGIRKRHRLWEASIRSGESYFYLGHFGTASDAAKAYDAKARELFGAAAKQNFPEAVA